MSQIAGICLFLALISYASPARACTTHCFDTANGPVFGANLDLFIPADGLVFANKRGISKRGFDPGTTGKTAEWVSKYGSITFNLAGKEWAFGGMNEAGLAIGSMELLASEFPQPDERTPLPIGPFAQYILDTCATVEEAARVPSRIRIQDDAAPVHFLISDASGATIGIEWFDGELVIHSGEGMHVRAMSNMPYERALEAYKRGKPRWWWSNPGQSAERFAMAAKRGFDYNPETNDDPVGYALYTMFHVVSAPHTKWNIVYHLGTREIWYRTVRSHDVKYINMEEFDFSCESELLMLDVNAPVSGNVREHFTPYDSKISRDHLRLLCERLNTALPENIIQSVSRHVDSFDCK